MAPAERLIHLLRGAALVGKREQQTFSELIDTSPFVPKAAIRFARNYGG